MTGVRLDHIRRRSSAGERVVLVQHISRVLRRWGMGMYLETSPNNRHEKNRVVRVSARDGHVVFQDLAGGWQLGTAFMAQLLNLA